MNDAVCLTIGGLGTSSALSSTWGSGRWILCREAKWGLASAYTWRTSGGSPPSSPLLVDAWPEGALCDFAKMVFTDPSRNTDQGVYHICECAGGETNTRNESD